MVTTVMLGGAVVSLGVGLILVHLYHERRVARLRDRVRGLETLVGELGQWRSTQPYGAKPRNRDFFSPRNN